MDTCFSELTVTGIPERVREFDEAFCGPSAPWGLGPDEIRGKSPQEIVVLEGELAKRDAEKSYCMNALYPVPDEVLEAGYSTLDTTDHIELIKYMERVSDPDKWEDGYGWCTSHWGTKSDLLDVRVHNNGVDGEATYSFDTAHSPPLLWLEKVAKEWPELQFNLVYEQGYLHLAGQAVFVGGALFKEDTFEGEEYRTFAEKCFGVVEE
jgi:hypothetical protein